MSDELLPCPFCGGEPEVERQGTSRQSMIVACTDCGCRVESGDTFPPFKWNHRVSLVPQPNEDADRFLILSLKWSRTSDYLVWWKPEGKGYTARVDDAGRYTAEQVIAGAGHLDNRQDTMAVPVPAAVAVAKRIVTHESEYVRAWQALPALRAVQEGSR